MTRRPWSCTRTAAAAFAMISAAAFSADDVYGLELALDTALAEHGSAGVDAERPFAAGEDGAVALALERSAPADAAEGVVPSVCATGCGYFAELAVAPGVVSVASDRTIVPFSGLAAADGIIGGESGASSVPSAAKLSPTWRLGPIRWNGTLGNGFAWAGSSGQSTVNVTQTAALSASSYVWQPWFLLVGGSASLTQSSSSNSTSSSSVDGLSNSNSNPSSSGSTVVSRTKGIGLSGGVTLDFLPQSRFPFSAALSTQQSTTTAIERTTTGGYNARIRGQYAPAEGKARYAGGYSRNVATVDGQAIGATDQIFGDYSNFIPKYFYGAHAVTAGGNWTRSSTPDHSNDNAFFRVHGHADSDYYDDYGIKLYSNVEYYTNDNRGASGGASTVSVFQLSSSGSWVPEDDLPVTVNGTVAFSSLQSDSLGSSSSSQTGSASVSASYQYSPHISLGAGLTAQWTPDGASIAGNGSVSASYSGQPRQFGDFNYNWSANAGANGATSGASSLSSGLNHQLSRTILLGLRDRISLSINQAVSVNRSGTLGASGTLSTSATAAYALAPSAATSMNFSLSGSDSRAFGNYGTDYQTLAMLASGSMQLSRFSSVTANISANISRTGASKTAGTDLAGAQTEKANARWVAGGSGVLSYQHGRAFGISRLRYNANYLLTPSGWSSSNSNDSSSPGGLTNPNLLPNQRPGVLWSHAFTQGVSYRLGRISANLTNAFNVSGQQKNASILLSVVREIGNY